MFSVGTVSSILKEHKKTITLLNKREAEIGKNEEDLWKKQEELALKLKSTDKEKRAAKAASKYLEGLFKAMESA